MSRRLLQPCPAKPNCVCSEDQQAEHAIAVFPLLGEFAPSWAHLRQLLDSWRGAKLVESREGYLHYVFTTPLLRFKDDVEFAFDAEKRVIQVRSASRLGYSDFGTNRKRVEAIRVEYLKKI